MSEYRVAHALLRNVAIRRSPLELKVRIRTGFKQQPGNVERRDRVFTRYHSHRTVTLYRQGADIGRHVERRTAEEIPFVDIRTGFDHVCGELEMQIKQRNVQP